MIIEIQVNEESTIMEAYQIDMEIVGQRGRKVYKIRGKFNINVRTFDEFDEALATINKWLHKKAYEKTKPFDFSKQLIHGIERVSIKATV